MCGIFTIMHRFKPNVGKYTIHGSSMDPRGIGDKNEGNVGDGESHGMNSSACDKLL